MSNKVQSQASNGRYSLFCQRKLQNRNIVGHYSGHCFTRACVEGNMIIEYLGNECCRWVSRTFKLIPQAYRSGAKDSDGNLNKSWTVRVTSKPLQYINDTRIWRGTKYKVGTKAKTRTSKVEFDRVLSLQISLTSSKEILRWRRCWEI